MVWYNLCKQNLLNVGIWFCLQGCVLYSDAPYVDSADTGFEHSLVQTDALPMQSVDAYVASNTQGSDLGSIDSGAVDESWCDEPGRLSVCMFCNTQNEIFMPDTDPQCPEIMCPSTLGVERVEDEFAAHCVAPRLSEPIRPCAAVGQCAGEAEFCGLDSKRITFGVPLNGCLNLDRCLEDGTGQTSARAVGVDCVFSGSQRFRQLRLQIEDVTQSFTLVSVQLAVLSDSGSPEFPTYALTEVLGDNGDDLRSILEEGSGPLMLTQDAQISLTFAQAAPFSFMKIFIEPSDGTHRFSLEAITDDGLSLLSESIAVDAQQRDVMLMPQGHCNGSGNCLPSVRLDCAQIISEGRGGELCAESQDESNRYCEFFVPYIGIQRTCAEVCEASGRTCIQAADDTNDDCRTRDRKTCTDRMNDFVCRCG